MDSVQRDALSLADRAFAMTINYCYSEYRQQRVVGPPKNMFTVDHKDSEVFISKLPANLGIEAVFAAFKECGRIYQIRVMRDHTTGLNNGLAYVAYFSEDSAARAIQFLNYREITPGHPIMVEKSFDNRRLYIGGVPPSKLRDEIWKELQSKGINGIVDVITYRAYKNPSQTRGFAFVEFESHNLAAKTLSRFNNLYLFSLPVTMDWSIPLAEVPDETMKNSCKLFMRNLQLHWTNEQIKSLVEKLIHPRQIVKVYKFKDYAFIHFWNRYDAEIARSLLRVHFLASPVEIEWGKPRSRVTAPAFRNRQISKLVAKKRNAVQPQRPTSTGSSSYSDTTYNIQELTNAIVSLNFSDAAIY